jgi:hypothetical protein
LAIPDRGLFVSLQPYLTLQLHIRSKVQPAQHLDEASIISPPSVPAGEFEVSMADVTSSIITIANVSLVIIEKTVRYIKDINLVNDLIKDLLAELKALCRLIGVVTSTYKQTGPSDDSPASKFVGKTLSICQERMDRLKPLVIELAALESETWLQKFTAKRRLDRVRKEINSIMKNIRLDMDSMNIGMSCWSLDVASAHRRLSEAAARQAVATRAAELDLTQEHTNPITRTLSEAPTVFGHDPNLQLRQMPTAISSCSRSSISSTSSTTLPALSDRSNSIASTAAAALVDCKSDWENFHFHITKCKGSKERIREIRDILEHHTDGATLAKSTDAWLRTPLHVAAQRGDVDLAQILVTFGADINAQDSEPSSVLDLAVAGRHRSFVSFLLDLGVDQSALLPQNTKKLSEMKRTIQFEKKAVQKKNRTLSNNIQSEILM